MILSVAPWLATGLAKAAARNVICRMGAAGISDIEGKVAGVAASELGNERVSNRTRFWRSLLGFSQEPPPSARSRSFPDDVRGQG
jgi:hypothetical protein